MPLILILKILCTDNSLLIETGIFNSLPTEKILHCFELKAFADNKLDVIEKLKLHLGWVENIVGNGENAGCQHFFYLQCFQMASRLLKVGLCGKGL